MPFQTSKAAQYLKDINYSPEEIAHTSAAHQHKDEVAVRKVAQFAGDNWKDHKLQNKNMAWEPSKRQLKVSTARRLRGFSVWVPKLPRPMFIFLLPTSPPSAQGLWAQNRGEPQKLREALRGIWSNHWGKSDWTQERTPPNMAQCPLTAESHGVVDGNPGFHPDPWIRISGRKSGESAFITNVPEDSWLYKIRFESSSSTETTDSKMHNQS